LRGIILLFTIALISFPTIPRFSYNLVLRRRILE
jgi:hypothetical protein